MIDEKNTEKLEALKKYIYLCRDADLEDEIFQID